MPTPPLRLQLSNWIYLRQDPLGWRVSHVDDLIQVMELHDNVSTFNRCLIDFIDEHTHALFHEKKDIFLAKIFLKKAKNLNIFF